MSDVVHTTIVGRLTADAELREAGGTSVLKARVASKPYGSEESMFFSVDVWGKRGEALEQYLTKGQQVVVLGGLKVREYESNGEKRYSLDVRAEDIVLVGSKPERDASASESSSDEADDDDMDF